MPVLRMPLILLLIAALFPARLVAADQTASADAATPVVYKKLPSGRYAAKVSGMLTTTCGRAIEREVSKLKEVESAKVDFDAERLVVTVRLDKTLRVSVLSRALHRAARKVNLGTDYVLGALTYLP